MIKKIENWKGINIVDGKCKRVEEEKRKNNWIEKKWSRIKEGEINENRWSGDG